MCMRSRVEWGELARIQFPGAMKNVQQPTNSAS